MFLQTPVPPVGDLQSDIWIFLAITVIAITNLAQAIIAEQRKRKENENQHQIEHALLNIERYLRILADKFTEEVTDIQMPIIVDEFVLHAKESIIRMAATSINNNEIKGHEREVLSKVDNFICNRFKDMVIHLGRFKWHGSSMSEYIDLSYKQKIIQNVQEIVVKERYTHEEKTRDYKTVISYLDQKFDEIRNSIKAKAYG